MVCDLLKTDEWLRQNMQFTVVEYTMVYSCTAQGKELL